MTTATTRFESELREAAQRLQAGGLVAFPTETVYGLGGNALSDHAVAAIYETKGRPEFNPLIVHVSSLEEAKRYALFTPAAEALAKQFWPGPLTLVLPRAPTCALSLLVSAGLDTVAIRVPAHPVALSLLRACERPIAAPSANRSGRISPTDADHVRQEFDDKLIILDGGPCEIGLESTVVDMTGNEPLVLRPGFVTPTQISAKIGSGQSIKSPGMLEKHYAPEKMLRLQATEVKIGEGLLAFGTPLPGAAIVENLSADRDLREAAANLFRMLRRLDASAAEGIAAMPIPEEGLGIAINDRLKRAAAR